MRPCIVLLLLFLLTLPARALEIVPADAGPVNPWALLRLDINGATAEQLKTAAVHHWPKDTAVVQAGYDWSGKPYLLFQGAVPGDYWLSVCSPVDGGLESAEIVVQVGGPRPEPKPDPDDDEPGPDPEPQPLDWLTGLSKWVAEEAAKAMPGRADEAHKWADAIRRTAVDAAGGKITDWAVFRVTLKERGFDALGYKLATEWNDKFDDPILTPRIEKEMEARGFKTPEDAAAMWSAVADGLERMVDVPKGSAAAVESVQLVFFGASWCKPCEAMRPIRDRLRAAGWAVGYLDVDRHAGHGWVKWRARTGTTTLPHMLIVIDGQPWQETTGAKSMGYLVDWLSRARNEWRERHGLEPVAFKAYGDTLQQDPQDRQVFFREHWRMTPGTCGMMGCTIHGGGYRKELVPVFGQQAVSRIESSAPMTVGSSCPSCGR